MKYKYMCLFTEDSITLTELKSDKQKEKSPGWGKLITIIITVIIINIIIIIIIIFTFAYSVAPQHFHCFQEGIDQGYPNVSGDAFTFTFTFFNFYFNLLISGYVGNSDKLHHC